MSTTTDHSTGNSTAFRFSRRPWVVPAAVAAVVVGSAVAVPLIADADSELPERDAAELIAGLAESHEVPFAGTLVHSADLGLPDMSMLAGDESSPWALLSGATTARVWYTDTSTFRVALQGELSEIDLIRDGEDYWYWDSEQDTVYRETVEPGSRLDDELEQGPEQMMSPDLMARVVLGLIEPSTDVEVDGTATVAGRAAYELVFSPKDESSLIGSLRVAIDGEHGVPLRLQIHSAAGGDPVVELGFTSISFDEPDPSVYEFTPPEGAEVEEFDLDGWLGGFDDEHGKDPDEWPDVSVDVEGEDWTSVVVISGLQLDDVVGHLEGLSGEPGEQIGDLSAAAEAFFDEMERVEGPYGSGRGFQSELFSLLWLDDGRLLLGAVSLDALEEAAS